MIRGALILAVGFSLGYAKAIQEQEELKDLLASAKEAFDKLVEDEEGLDAVFGRDTPGADDVGQTGQDVPPKEPLEGDFADGV